MENTKDILVSVVIPTYSRNVTLSRAIDTVLVQTHKKIEVIIVDDNPSDSLWRKSTEALMKQYDSDKRIIYIQNEKNLGGSGARNVGISVAKGEYIAFLDDDDEYFPEKIEKQLKCFLNTTQDNLALVFCDSVMTYDNDRFVCNVTPRYYGCCLYEAMVNNCLAATSQWMAKKDALLKVGMFTIVPCKQDATLILKLLEAGYEVECVPEILSKYCNYEGNRISDTKMKNLNGELAYKKRCEKLYDRLTVEQIKEVEYAFASRLYFFYQANGMRKEKNESMRLMLKTHLLRTLSYFLRIRARNMKNSLMRKGGR